MPRCHSGGHCTAEATLEPSRVGCIGGISYSLLCHNTAARFFNVDPAHGAVGVQAISGSGSCEQGGWIERRTGPHGHRRNSYCLRFGLPLPGNASQMALKMSGVCSQTRLASMSSLCCCGSAVQVGLSRFSLRGRSCTKIPKAAVLLCAVRS